MPLASERPLHGENTRSSVRERGDSGGAFSNEGKRIGIFVIAFNAESHIRRTLARIPAEIWGAIEVVYVIDDCSTDETVAKALELRRHHPNIEVLRNPINKRYGGNQKLGYRYAIERGLDVVVMLHADGQYAPEYLPRILTPLVSDQADIVMGSRMLDRGGALRGGMPKYKYVGNLVLTSIENSLSNLALSEFHSGYRGYRTSFLRSVPFWENSDEWHFDTQILLQAKRACARICEVPIPTYYGDEICHVNGLLYGMNCILTSVAYALHCRGLLYRRIYDISPGANRYASKTDDPYSSHSLIWEHMLKLDLRNLRILELGVGDASLTRLLFDAGATVDVIEVDPAMAEAAAPFCRKLLVWDLNHFAELAVDERYDVVIAADVLEHLVHPEYALAEIKKYMKKNGELIVSLPNIANFTVRFALLFGRFSTHKRGILDETHLHHYTFRTMQRMLHRTGWMIRSRAVTTIPLQAVLPVFGRFPFRLLRPLLYSLTRLFRGLLGYQGIFFCSNPNEPISS